MEGQLRKYLRGKPEGRRRMETRRLKWLQDVGKDVWEMKVIRQ